MPSDLTYSLQKVKDCVGEGNIKGAADAVREASDLTRAAVESFEAEEVVSDAAENLEADQGVSEAANSAADWATDAANRLEAEDADGAKTSADNARQSADAAESYAFEASKDTTEVVYASKLVAEAAEKALDAPKFAS